MDWDTLGKRLSQLGEDTKNSVHKLSESVQMNSRLSEANRKLQDQYAAIGKLVLDRFEEDVPEELEEAFTAVRQAKETVEELEKQIRRRKGVTICPECGRQVAVGEKFCGQCGAKLPEEPEEEQKDTSEDTCEETQEKHSAPQEPEEDLAKAAAGKAKEFLGSVADNAATFMKGVSDKLNENKEEAEAVQGDYVSAEQAQGAAGDFADEVIRAAQGEDEPVPAQQPDAVQEEAEETAASAAEETEKDEDPTADAE